MVHKKVVRQLTIELEAGNAGMVDLGKMLGPTGINMRQVKLDYDAATAAQRGEIVPVVVTVFEDRSYALRYKTPPTAYLIRRTIGTGATISPAQLRAIAERKLPDLNTDDLGAAMRQIAGTARSMGVSVEVPGAGWP
jgi:large subunit ribosomal protein L11